MPNFIQSHRPAHRQQPRRATRPTINGTPVLLPVANPLKTSAWKRYSKWRLQEFPFCVTPGCGRLADTTDHIIPWSRRMDLFMEPTNHQSLCHSCHSRKTVTEDGGFGNAQVK